VSIEVGVLVEGHRHVLVTPATGTTTPATTTSTTGTQTPPPQPSTATASNSHTLILVALIAVAGVILTAGVQLWIGSRTSKASQRLAGAAEENVGSARLAAGSAERTAGAAEKNLVNAQMAAEASKQAAAASERSAAASEVAAEAARSSAATAEASHELGVQSAAELEERSKREEVLTLIRWAVELAVSADEAKARLGRAELHELRLSPLVGPADMPIITAALRALLAPRLRLVDDDDKDDIEIVQVNEPEDEDDQG
jgi:hypothetical protein